MPRPRGDRRSQSTPGQHIRSIGQQTRGAVARAGTPSNELAIGAVFAAAHSLAVRASDWFAVSRAARTSPAAAAVPPASLARGGFRGGRGSAIDHAGPARLPAADPTRADTLNIEH